MPRKDVEILPDNYLLHKKRKLDSRKRTLAKIVELGKFVYLFGEYPVDIMVGLREKISDKTRRGSVK